MSSSTTNPRQALAWAGIVLVLGLSVWFGWNALRDSKPESGPGGSSGGVRPPSTIIFRPAEEKEMVEILSVTGTLRAVRRAKVAAREAAAVELLKVNEGDTVKSGDVIATLDGRRLAAQVAEAEAALIESHAGLAQRKAEHERSVLDEKMMRDLWDQRAVAEREYLDSVRGLKVASARENAASESIAAAEKRRDLLKVRLADLNVTAPFTGRVVARHTERGEWVKEGDPVITLVSTGEIEAWLQLPERHAAALKQSAPVGVDLRVPGRVEPIHADKLSLVPDVEGRSRRFTLIARVLDPDNTLTPGSSVEASVPLGNRERRLVVASDAVLKSYAGTYVYIVDEASDGPPKAKRVPVDVVFQRNGEAVLASGSLKAGDRVIVEGNERLFPNTLLDPIAWEDSRSGKMDGKPETVGTR